MREYGGNRRKRKVCLMSTGTYVDYKDVELIKKLISNDKGKILPRRVTGSKAKYQRHIAREIQKARYMALIPFVK